MARRGEVVENPITGERITFLETTGDTGGELLRFEYVLPPRFSIPEHVHPRQEERHEVLSGTLRGRVGGRERDFGEGERVIGPAGVPHAWRNPSEDKELCIVSELRPALRMEAVLETLFGLARDGKTFGGLVPRNPLRLAVMASEVRDDFYSTGAPIPVQKPLFALLEPLAFVGRRLGYGNRYPEYRGPA